MMNPTKKIGVIGGSAGMGSWLVQFFREADFEVKFTAKETGEFETNAELVQNSDIVFLSVPIFAMTEVLEEIYPYLHGKVLFEVCSVKKFVVEKFLELQHQLPDIEVEFHSVHPMYSQQITKLQGQVVLLNYSNRIGGEFLDFFQEILTKEGAFVYHVGYKRHDKIMGIVQGLNHFNVFVSAKTLSKFDGELETVKKFSSPTYRIFLIYFTRYVLQNPRLYADIQIYNEYVLEVLQIFREEADMLYHYIKTKNRTGFIKYVEEMQHFFAGNTEDSELSTRLIHQLGQLLKED